MEIYSQDRYFIAVESVTEDHRGGVEIYGIYSDSLINRKDVVHIFGIEGYVDSKVIEDVILNQTEFEEIGYGQVRLRLSDISIDEIEPGDVLTNVYDQESDLVDNVHLKGLLYYGSTYSESLLHDHEEMYHKLLETIVDDSPVLLPAEIVKGSPSEYYPNVGGDNIVFKTLRHPSGNLYLGLYTSYREQLPSENGNYDDVFSVKFEEVLDIVERDYAYDGIIYNPYSDHVLFTRDDLKELTNIQKLVRQQNHKVGGNVIIKKHRHEPLPLTNNLQVIAEDFPSIETMWILLMNNQGLWSHLLIIDHNDDPQTLFETVGQKISDRGLLNELALDIISLNDPFSKHVIAEYKPFYERNKLRH